MRRRIKDIRRQDLELAAYTVLEREGFAGTTLAKVAEEVGMSRGIVHHYFADKNELLEAAIRLSNRRIGQATVGQLKQARTPTERLVAVIEGYFGDGFSRRAAQFWMFFLAQTPVSERYARLQRLLVRRAHSNLIHELRHFLPIDRARSVAWEVCTFMDGLYLRQATGNRELTKAEAVSMVADILGRHLPDFPEAVRARHREPPLQDAM